MPAPAHRGATAIQRPDQPSAVRKDWGWPALPCSRAAHSRPIRLSRCAVDADVLANFDRCRPRARHAGLGCQSAGRDGRPRRSVASPGHGWWPRNRTYSAACDTPRPGGLFDRLAMLADGGKLPAPTILTELLQQLGPIWPSRLTLGGIALGDCWTASGADDRGCDQRSGAAAQALAMAGRIPSSNRYRHPASA